MFQLKLHQFGPMILLQIQIGGVHCLRQDRQCAYGLTLRRFLFLPQVARTLNSLLFTLAKKRFQIAFPKPQAVLVACATRLRFSV
jgi:hypothetical protein